MCVCVCVAYEQRPWNQAVDWEVKSITSSYFEVDITINCTPSEDTSGIDSTLYKKHVHYCIISIGSHYFSKMYLNFNLLSIGFSISISNVWYNFS